MAISLNDRIVLVTGASSGLGARFARTLAESGAVVILAARRVARLNDLASDLVASGCRAHTLELDVTDVPLFPAKFEDIERMAGGPATVLINAAGVAAAEPAGEATLENFTFQMDVNVRGVFFVAQEFARRLVNAGQPGRIVNVASVVGQRPFPNLSVYGMTKAAVIHMTKAMALEWGPQGIQSNVICPGYVLTEMNEMLWDTERGQQLKSRLPLKRVGSPCDLDDAMLFLAGSDSDFTNGSVLSVDDGLSIWF